MATSPNREPVIKPINGIVQPPIIPPFEKIVRNTNQTRYLLRTVMEALWNNENSEPFQRPVDTKKLNLTDYHAIITQPMDLRTIKRRLENTYYWSAEECINDFNRIFLNCYIYNTPGDDVFIMAQKLEKLFFTLLKRMPKYEITISHNR